MDATGLPYLPGTSTVSEMLAVAERGRTEMKFFPAEAAGGAPYLASLASPSGSCGSAPPAASLRPPPGTT
jgi:2-dehydro-3-deoxyphosphogluconate aldolase/(4S)-4-hydroxy-2-oxoglutarate aldolase